VAVNADHGENRAKGDAMNVPEEAYLLRIFVGESDRWNGKPAYEAVVLEARSAGLAGASVFRGCMGFGAHSRMHTAKILRLSEDLPMLIEIVDALEKIEAFLPKLNAIVGDGLITMEKIRVLKYHAGPSQAE
jgi:PII-like signaling protein